MAWKTVLEKCDLIVAFDKKLRDQQSDGKCNMYEIFLVVVTFPKNTNVNLIFY